jgi:hypothetical protein
MISDAANFLRNLLTGRKSSVEEWGAWEYLLLHGVVKAKRWSDYRDRTHEAMDNIKAWLRRQRDYFLNLTDEQLVDAGSVSPLGTTGPIHRPFVASAR